MCVFSRKNDFEKMCDQLDSHAKIYSYENPIFYVEEHVQQYVQGDIKRFLRLKAEANGITFNEYLAQLVSCVTLILSVIAVYISMHDWLSSSQQEIGSWIWALIFVAIIVGVCIYVILAIRNYKTVVKWQKYVIVVIEALDTDKDNIIGKMNQKESYEEINNYTGIQ